MTMTGVIRDLIRRAADCITERPGKDWADWVVYLMEEIEARDEEGGIDECLVGVKRACEIRISEEDW